MLQIFYSVVRKAPGCVNVGLLHITLVGSHHFPSSVSVLSNTWTQERWCKGNRFQHSVFSEAIHESTTIKVKQMARAVPTKELRELRPCSPGSVSSDKSQRHHLCYWGFSFYLIGKSEIFLASQSNGQVYSSQHPPDLLESDRPVGSPISSNRESFGCPGCIVFSWCLICLEIFRRPHCGLSVLKGRL